ncbi:MAG: flagellin [bacterium]|nr:flagellin [bacterium]
MAQVINTNVLSLNAQINLGKSSKALATSLERLSSGLRINSAKDDAAGLGISTRLSSQTNGMNQAIRNANDAISLSQIAEGGMQESTNVLQRMRDLAVQAANGTNNTADRTSINNEVTQLKAELDRVSTNTTFNNQKILDGTFSSTGMSFQIGAEAGQTLSVTIGSVSSAALAVDAVDVSGADGTGASAAITAIDAALDSITSSRGQLGAVQNRLDFTISSLETAVQYSESANSRIRDADFAAETATLTKNQILVQAGTAMLAQANQSTSGVLSLLKG